MNKIEGLFFVQLGSPEALDTEKIAQYLYEFLGDWHTLGKKIFFWKFLLRHMILPKAKLTSLGKYKRMFDRNGFTEMPLVTYSNAFVNKIRKQMPDLPVELAFQYGCKPSVKDALENFRKKGVETIRVVPLYPQRAGVTTDAANDMVRETAKEMHLAAKILYANGFYKSKAWVREIVKLVQPILQPEDTLIVSCHAIQSWRVEKGDPYKDECEASAKAIGEALGVTPVLAYQSKAGHGKWLEPTLIDTVKKLGAEHKPIVIVSPIFTADNLETISEIDDEVAEIYKAAGGTSLKRVPCLNDNDSWVKAFVEEVLPNIEFKE